MLDPSTPAGSKAAALLEDAVVIWLTTVDAKGQPKASPVWFVVEDGEFLIYSLANTSRVRNIRANPQVSLNLDSREGGDVVVVEGVARIVDGVSSEDHQAYQDKYRSHIASLGYTPAQFAAGYPISIRVAPTRWRVH
jgi:PPOX class probable F420-dependent enzyme